MTDNNLDQLVERTERKLHSQAAREKTRPPHRFVPWLLKGLLTLMIAVSLNHLAVNWISHSVITDQAIRADLVQLLYQAKASIQSEVDETGRFPSGIPDNTLVALVRYDLLEQGYTLSVQLGEHRASLDAAGELRVDGVVVKREEILGESAG